MFCITAALVFYVSLTSEKTEKGNCLQSPQPDVVWRPGTTTLFLLGSFLAPMDCTKIPAQSIEIHRRWGEICMAEGGMGPGSSSIYILSGFLYGSP